MKKILYFCDHCKRRIRKDQRIWLMVDNQYHSDCKYGITKSQEEKELIENHSKRLEEFLYE